MTSVKNRFSRSTRRSVTLMLPALFFITALGLFPILRGVYFGFTDYRIGLGHNFNWFQNYITIARNGHLGIAFRNTVLITFISIVIVYILSLILALLLDSDIPFKKLFRTLLIVPWAVPPVARIWSWNYIFNGAFGPLNAVLLDLGFIDRPIVWLAHPNFALGAIITVIVWGCIPFTVMSFLSAFQSIPKENYEAAMVDGANSFQRLWYITLPHLKAITAVTMSLLFMWISNDFPSQFLLTNGGPGTATLTIAVEAYLQAFRQGNFGLATAYGNVMIVFCLFVLFFYLRAMSEKDKGVRT